MATSPTLAEEFLIATRLGEMLWEGYPSHRTGEAARKVDWLSSACLLLRRTALTQVGLLDEQYFIYGDETDLQYRLIKGGWSVYYLPHATTIHFGGRSMDRWRRRRMVYRGKMLFFKKNYDPLRHYALRAMLGIADGRQGGRVGAGLARAGVDGAGPARIAIERRRPSPLPEARVVARILFLSQLLPLPLDAGPKIRAYYVLRHLAEAGHEVTLVCFVRPSDKESDVARAWQVLPRRRDRPASPFARERPARRSEEPVLRPPVPHSARRGAGDGAARSGGSLDRGSWDAVHADQLWMAPYAARCGGVPLKVLDQHNAVFRVPERLAANQRNPLAKALLRREAQKLGRFERETVERFDRVVWVTEEDRAAFPPHAGRRARDAVIPIAVDPAATVSRSCGNVRSA